MKKIISHFFIIIFLYQANLSAMNLFSIDFNRNERVNFHNELAQEAENAARTIKSWLTRDVIVGVDNADVSVVELSDELSRGEVIVLTDWHANPGYMLLVFRVLDNLYNRRESNKLKHALIEFNFGKKVLEKLIKYINNKKLKFQKDYSFYADLSPYLKDLKPKLEYLSSVDFEEEIEKICRDIKISNLELSKKDLCDIIFLLQNPYFFMGDIIVMTDSNKMDFGSGNISDAGNRIIELVLEFGFDVNCRLREGCDHRDTLLHRAVRYDDVNMVELLLKWGADPLICYERQPDPLKRGIGAGQSPWELSCYKMRGDSWVTPNRPPSEKTQKIHEMLRPNVQKSNSNILLDDV